MDKGEQFSRARPFEYTEKEHDGASSPQEESGPHAEEETPSSAAPVEARGEKKETPPFSAEDLSHIRGLLQRKAALKDLIETAKTPNDKIRYYEELRGTNDELLVFTRRMDRQETTGGDFSERIEELIKEINTPLPEGQEVAVFHKSRGQFSPSGLDRYISKGDERKHIILDLVLERKGFVPDPGKEYVVRVRDTRPGMMSGALIATEVLGESPQEKLIQLMREEGHVIASNFARTIRDQEGRTVRRSDEEIEQYARDLLQRREGIEDIRILPTARDSSGRRLPIDEYRAAWVKPIDPDTRVRVKGSTT